MTKEKKITKQNKNVYYHNKPASAEQTLLSIYHYNLLMCDPQTYAPS